MQRTYPSGRSTGQTEIVAGLMETQQRAGKRPAAASTIAEAQMAIARQVGIKDKPDSRNHTCGMRQRIQAPAAIRRTMEGTIEAGPRRATRQIVDERQPALETTDRTT